MVVRPTEQVILLLITNTEVAINLALTLDHWNVLAKASTDVMLSKRYFPCAPIFRQPDTFLPVKQDFREPDSSYQIERVPSLAL